MGGVVRGLAFATLFCAPFALIGACGQNALVAKGQPCFQSIDCQLGLACVPQQNDAGSICSDDLSGISSVPEAGGDAAAQPDTPLTDSPIDQVTQDNNVPETTQDTSTQDTSTPDAPPPTDAGAG
jgi:hypothetical protein